MLILPIQYCMYIPSASAMAVYISWWCHECNGFSNYRQPDCLFNMFKVPTNKTIRLRITELCKGNAWVTDVSPPKYINAESVAMWWMQTARPSASNKEKKASGALLRHFGNLKHVGILFSYKHTWTTIPISVVHQGAPTFYIHVVYLTLISEKYLNTVKPVCNDHLYNKIYYMWFIQLCVLIMTESINLLMLIFSAFWSSSWWPLAT